MEDIKSKVLELASIAKECPENLQVKCFELLLTDFLSKHHIPAQKGKMNPGNEGVADRIDQSNQSDNNTGFKQEDIQDRDLHVKVKSMMKKEGVTIEQINQIFYKEDGEIKPLFDDLKTTKAAESQIRIALLNALKNAIHAGEFKFDGEEIRKDTQQWKCYDAPNFAANFKNNKALFDNFDAYDKSNPGISLSTDGKTKLAEVIKALQ